MERGQTPKIFQRDKYQVSETVTDVLNKIEAILECGAGKLNGLARHVGCRPQRISEYIRQRKHQPGVADYLLMKEWASKMTLRIAMAGREMQAAYVIAYTTVCKKRKAV